MLLSGLNFCLFNPVPSVSHLPALRNSSLAMYCHTLFAFLVYAPYTCTCTSPNAEYFAFSNI